METEIFNLAEISLLIKLYAIPAMFLSYYCVYRFVRWVVDAVCDAIKFFKKRKAEKIHEPEDEDIGRTE